MALARGRQRVHVMARSRQGDERIDWLVAGVLTLAAVYGMARLAIWWQGV
jgi:hypothetical protein